MTEDTGARLDAPARTVVAFLGALTALALASNLASEHVRRFGFVASIVHGGVWAASLVLATEWVLRREGWSLGLLLPGRRRTGAALVAFLGFWLLANLLQVLLGLWYGIPFEAGAVVTQPLLAVGALAVEFVFTGLPEELAFRGYLQTRFVEAVPSGMVTRVTAVALAAGIFAVWHLPNRVLGIEMAPAAAAVSVGWVFVDALFVFAVVYGLTRDVVLAGLVHAFLNEGRFLVALDGAHGSIGTPWTVGVVAAAATVSLGYRWWVRHATGRSPRLRPSVAGAD